MSLADIATHTDLQRLEQLIETMRRDHARELAEQRRIVTDFVESQDDQVSTAKALQLTGIKSRTTLIAERQRPDTLLRWTQNGRSVGYSRASCLAHKRAHERQAA